MKSYRGLTGLFVAIVLGLVLTVQLGAQTKKVKSVTYQGRVQAVDKSKMSIVIKNGNVERTVMYTADTKFMYGHSNDNKPGTADAVKDTFYISCAGTPEAGKPNMTATTCVYRETK